MILGIFFIFNTFQEEAQSLQDFIGHSMAIITIIASLARRKNISDFITVIFSIEKSLILQTQTADWICTMNYFSNI